MQTDTNRLTFRWVEIESNTRRVMEVLGNGRHLIYNESEKLKQAVRERLGNISSQWDYLQEKTKEKNEKLKEVSKQYDHIMGIKYINFWMGDIETLLINQDIGNAECCKELVRTT